jgi:uncharacterized membrane protein
MKSFVDKFLSVILIVVMLGAIAALGYVFLQFFNGSKSSVLAHRS